METQNISNDSKTIGLVPARSGSKRIMNKNVRNFNGKPLISYTFETAKKSSLLSRLVVSTDDEQVVSLANQYDIEVPFIRPKELADDYATDLDWIQHAVEFLEKEGWYPDYIVILRPTSPFRKTVDIDKAIKQLIKYNSDSVRSLTKVNHHPYWMKVLDGNVAKPLIDVGKPDEQLRSQDLPPVYRINGVVDVFKRQNLEHGSLYGNNMGYIIIDEERSLDIDTKEDFNYGEYLSRRR